MQKVHHKARYSGIVKSHRKSRGPSLQSIIYVLMCPICGVVGEIAIHLPQVPQVREAGLQQPLNEAPLKGPAKQAAQMKQQPSKWIIWT